MVPLLVLLPALTSGGTLDVAALAITVGQAGLLFGLVSFVGVRAVPWLLGHTAVPRTRELFIIGVVSLALGTAVAAQAIRL